MSYIGDKNVFMICVFLEGAADLKSQENYSSFQRTSYQRCFSWKIVTFRLTVFWLWTAVLFVIRLVSLVIGKARWEHVCLVSRTPASWLIVPRAHGHAISEARSPKWPAIIPGYRYDKLSQCNSDVSITRIDIAAQIILSYSPGAPMYIPSGTWFLGATWRIRSNDPCVAAMRNEVSQTSHAQCYLTSLWCRK